jgi:hypothetical protein
MNQKSFIIAAILAAAALSVIATPVAFAQDMEEQTDAQDATSRPGDTSTTSTDQDVKQKNLGSGDSVNFNCGENLIKAGTEEQECDFED